MPCMRPHPHPPPPAPTHPFFSSSRPKATESTVRTWIDTVAATAVVRKLNAPWKKVYS